MRRPSRAIVALLAVAFAVASSEAAARPLAPPSPIDAGPDPSTPFYDAGNATLPPAPPVAKPSAKVFVVGPSIGVGEYFVPAIDSGGAVVSTTLEMGNDLVSGGFGYVDFAGAHGFELELALLRWAAAIEILDSHGWRGTWLLPDLSAKLDGYPGQDAPPSWAMTFETRLGGFRFARCFPGYCLEMSAAAVAGPGAVHVEDSHFGVLVGGHLDVGFAFWR